GGAADAGRVGGAAVAGRAGTRVGAEPGEHPLAAAAGGEPQLVLGAGDERRDGVEVALHVPPAVPEVGQGAHVGGGDAELAADEDAVVDVPDAGDEVAAAAGGRDDDEPDGLVVAVRAGVHPLADAVGGA